MKIVIDRFEGEYAVCETAAGEFINILKNELPQNVKEADVLIYKGKKYFVDKVKTSKKKENINKLMDELWE